MHGTLERGTLRRGSLLRGAGRRAVDNGNLYPLIPLALQPYVTRYWEFRTSKYLVLDSGIVSCTCPISGSVMTWTGGKPAWDSTNFAQFDNVDDQLTLPAALSLAAPYSVFALVKPVHEQNIPIGNGTTNFAIFESSGTMRHRVNGNDDTCVAERTVGAWVAEGITKHPSVTRFYSTTLVGSDITPRPDNFSLKSIPAATGASLGGAQVACVLVCEGVYLSVQASVEAMLAELEASVS